MSSKFGLAGGLPERRVRPIWDAVDSRQYKNALKLCSALLSKNPNSPYALALKALILERMGKADEALSVCLNAKEFLYISDALLIDELTLSTMQVVFQRLDHLDMATSCYEYACGKFPNNLELMMGLFNCYVREYSFVKQQQIAIKMYKLVGEERFLLWAVCSIQLQVCYSSGGEKLLLLAEGLLKKHIASHSLHEPEALIVYISLLEQQAKFGDALEVISGKLGSLIMIEVDRLRLQGKLLAKAGDYAAAADVFQKVLELCPDDWGCFLNYLGCLLEDDPSLWEGSKSGAVPSSQPIDSNNMHLVDGVFGTRISAASTLMEHLLKEAKSDSLRCPHLGNLEIERRKILYGKGEVDKLVEALMQYFYRFGHLACFTSDIEMYLQVLDNGKQNEFLQKIKEGCESASNLPKITLGQSITLFKVQNLISDMFNLPIKELEEIAARMTHTFCANLQLSKDLDPQENMHGEELLSMSCNVLVQLFWRTKNLGYLLEAIMILEFGLTIRRHVWQYKVSLLHLYSHWGALPLAYERYKTLEVKNILLETVSHHIFPQMLASPLWTELDFLLSDYLRFMDDHFRESADLTFLAYRHRNYSKVIEFVQFKEKLQRSNQYLRAKVESPILQLKQKSNNIEEEEIILQSLKYGVDFVELSSEIGSKSVTFNEDLQFRPWWTPTYEKNYLLGPFDGVSYCPKENLDNQIKEAQTIALKTVEKRSLLPRMVYLSMQCASLSVKENIEGNGPIIDPKMPLELKVLLERYAQNMGFPFRDAMELVLSVSSGQKSSEVLHPNLIDWMNFVVFLNAWNLNSHEVRHPDNDTSNPSTWSLVNSLLKKLILENIGSIGLLISSPGCDFPSLVQLVTEPLAWHTIIIQACARSLYPSGKKKKKGGASEQRSSKLSREIQDCVHCICNILEEVAKWSTEQIDKSGEEKFDIVFSSMQNDELTEGPGKVFQIVKDLISSVHDAELGDRITQAVQSWSPHDVARTMITNQDALLSEFLKICELKSQSLKSLKVHM